MAFDLYVFNSDNDFSAYMSGSSSPSTSSAPTIYQLSSIPPPTTLTETPASIDSDLLKPPGKLSVFLLGVLVSMPFEKNGYAAASC